MKLRVIAVAAAVFAGCSGKAPIRGTTVEDLARCVSEACILSYAPVVVKRYPAHAEGDWEVLYRVPRAGDRSPRISGKRERTAPGVWVVVSTPMEGLVSSSREIVFKVSYRPGARVIQMTIQDN